jgi:sialate O-acetylesterase
MEWPLGLAADADTAVAAARDPLLRLYTVPRGVSDAPTDQVEGQWQRCTPDAARGFSAVAFYFGRSLRRSQNIPIGLIQSAWSGTPARAWTSRSALMAIPALASIVTGYELEETAYRKALAEYDAARELSGLQLFSPVGQPPDLPRPPANPTGKGSPAAVYNAMIAPLVPYGIRGVIWYQGESDTGAADQYRVLFPALIAGWRAEWRGPALSFLFVQLAPFMRRSDEPQESAWAELRDAQLATSRSVPRTGMAVITDAGDESDIHPRNKQVVGERLALLARSIVYGEPAEASGPVYESMRREGASLVLRFSHVAGGLEPAEGRSVSGFTVSGEDGRYVNAAAVIRGDTVVVSSPEVAHPVSVRYGWADYPQGDLRNKAGLPASPFRTDAPERK